MPAEEFLAMEDNCLVPLRDSETDGKEHSAEADHVKEIVDRLNVDLY